MQACSLFNYLDVFISLLFGESEGVQFSFIMFIVLAHEFSFCLNKFSYYVITGIATALMMVPAFTLLAKHFDKYYTIANGVTMSSGMIGLMVYAPVTQILLDTYGWRNTMLLLGGVHCHTVLTGALFPASHKRETHDDSQDDALEWMDLREESSISRLMNVSGLSLFKNFSFLANCFVVGSFTCTFTGWVIYFVPHCISKGLTPYEASFLATLSGVLFLIGFFANMPFIAKNIISVQNYLYLSYAVATISLVADVYCTTFTTIFLSNGCYLLFMAGTWPLLDVHLKSVVDEHSLSKAFGWRMTIGGLSRIVPGFFLGK